MADGINLNEGAGPKKVATDDVAGVHYQYIKLVSGYDQDTAVVPATTGKGLWVDVQGNTVRLQNTPVVSASPAYTAGDTLGGLITIPNAVRYSGGSGRLLAVTVLDKTQAQRPTIDFVFFDRTVTVAADNAAFATSDADMVFCLGVVPTALQVYNTAFAGTPLNSVSIHTLTQPLPFVLSGTSLFCAAIVRNTPTLTSTSDLVFSFLISQD